MPQNSVAGTAALNSFADPLVDTILSAASALLSMEVVYIGVLDDAHFTFARVQGGQDWGDFTEGGQMAVEDSLCRRMLVSGEWGTGDAAVSPVFSGAPGVERDGIRSYVGVPVRDSSGRVIATLCGVDPRRGREVGASGVVAATRAVLTQLAAVLAGHLGRATAETDDGVVIRRSGRGWTVSGDGGTDRADELTTAMVIADLLAADLTAPDRPPQEQIADDDEIGRLRRSVRQLEHALAARVVVEQAIGVLSERFGTPPRESFERLRTVARSQGRKVVDLSRAVVGSAVEQSAAKDSAGVEGAAGLPPQLSR